jgi:membrane protease YdiL (CAAX protease family)
VQKWVIVVPIIFVVGILLATDYGALSDKSAGFVLMLLLATQLVGWGEEGMFRGIGVTTLREHGLTEGKVALWSSLIFGLVHLSNAIGRGAGAIPQAVVVSLAGYFFYLTRRRTGGNAVNSVIHGFFDFSLLTGSAILVAQEAYIGSLAGILVYVVCVIVLLVRRRHIEVRAPGTP